MRRNRNGLLTTKSFMSSLGHWRRGSIIWLRKNLCSSTTIKHWSTLTANRIWSRCTRDKWVIYRSSLLFLSTNLGSRIKWQMRLRVTLLVTWVNEFTGFECSKELSADDDNFMHIWDHCINHQNAEDFLIQDGYLFKAN